MEDTLLVVSSEEKDIKPPPIKIIYYCLTCKILIGEEGAHIHKARDHLLYQLHTRPKQQI